MYIVILPQAILEFANFAKKSRWVMLNLPYLLIFNLFHQNPDTPRCGDRRFLLTCHNRDLGYAVLIWTLLQWCNSILRHPRNPGFRGWRTLSLGTCSTAILSYVLAS